MRPDNLTTKIFLDSGDPQETKKALKLLGFLDGQTTNPSLLAKNPETAGRKFSRGEIIEFYKKVVQEISELIPEGSVSIEVYADPSTSSGQMLKQAREFFAWIPPHLSFLSPKRGEEDGGAHIKLPITYEGLKAAEIAVKEGIRVNLTLCFSQEQAAAVYVATRGAKKGQVFISPFVGRLDDIGENGMDLVANIIKMYRGVKSHVEVLTASVRSIEHVISALRLGSDIITIPLKVLREWADQNFKFQAPNPKQFPIPNSQFPNLKPMPCKELDLNKPWQEYDIKHELTDKGVVKFSEDWNSLVYNS